MSDTDRAAVLQLLGGVNHKLSQSQKGAKVFEELQEGKLTVDQAVLQLVGIAREEGLMDELLQASQTMTALVPGSLTPDSLEQAQRPVTMETSTGIQQLNPLLEASIAERVSIDGDAPELRSGKLPPEGKPAVPVLTSSRDPVIVGLMLERASNEVGHELLEATKTHSALCERLLGDAEESARREGRDVPTALTLTQKKFPPAPVGVPGYQAGAIPALRTVEAPSPMVVSVMSPTARRVAIFRTLGTTPGRVSVAPVIEQGIREKLEEAGIPVNEGVPMPPGEEAHSFQTAWVMECFGPEDLSDNFNPIQTAIDVMLSALLVHVTTQEGGVLPEEGWAVKVIPYNGGISQRRFGWLTRIGPWKQE